MTENSTQTKRLSWLFYLAIWGYQGISVLVIPFLWILGRRRLKAGKESQEKVQERFGQASALRPAGRLVWFHSASIGESKIALVVARKLLDTDPTLHVLLTTQTLGAFLALPPMDRLIHQMAPWDSGIYVLRFLRYWHPEKAYIVEAEFWPCLLYQTFSRHIPLVSLNFHLSQASLQKWCKMRFFFKGLMSLFQKRYTSCQSSLQAFRSLAGDDLVMQSVISLKGFGGPAASVRQDPSLKYALSKRMFWLASCIHQEEVDLILKAHQALYQRFPGLLLILVPRHPATLIEEFQGQTFPNQTFPGQAFSFQKRSQHPDLKEETSCYVVDTFGELGLFYTLTPFAVLGGAFMPQGGHNLAEPAEFGCGVIHGPFIANNKDLYDKFLCENASCEVASLEDLIEKIAFFLENPQEAFLLGQRALHVKKKFEEKARRFLKDLAGEASSNL
jgi:3-deoxy-D-manno-octulosonic-acid transferase